MGKHVSIRIALMLICAGNLLLFLFAIAGAQDGPARVPVPKALREGEEIDKAFTEKERQLIDNALFTFYERILSGPIQLNFNTNGGNPTKEFKHFLVNPDYLKTCDEILQEYKNSMLSSQLSRLEKVIFDNGSRKFPTIIIHASNAVPGGDRDIDKKWGLAAAWAPVGTVTITKPKGKVWQEDSVIEGNFELTINRHYLLTPGRDEFSDRNYWAGIIAHEITHNLGHQHPDVSDENYCKYQINVLEFAVRCNGGYRPADGIYATRCGCK